MSVGGLIDQFEANENKAWCPVPWVSASTTTDGHYRLCVQANTDKKTRGLLRNSSGLPLRADSTPLREARNGELAKQTRLQMLRGEHPEVCVRCRSEEGRGLLSRKILSHFRYSQEAGPVSLQDCLEKTKEDGSIEHQDFPLYEIDLRLGNRCNLSCRSCYPGESSGWYQEWFDGGAKGFRVGEERYQLESKDGRARLASQSLEWFSGSEFKTNFHEDADGLKYLAIVGGEPLLITEHYDLLESLVASNRSQQIILEYNTNLTLLPDRVLQLWSKFKQVRIGYSLDGVGEVNDYIRWPSKFSEIVKNIHRLQAAPGNFELWPTLTLMAYNVLYIPEMIRWALESGTQKNIHPNNLFFVHHTLKYPEELSLKALPVATRAIIKKKLIEFRDGWFDSNVQFYFKEGTGVARSRLDYIYQSIFKEIACPYSEEIFLKFLDRTQKMDKFRGDSFASSLSELSKCISTSQEN